MDYPSLVSVKTAIKKGSTSFSKATTCFPKCKEDAAAGTMTEKTRSSSTKPSLEEVRSKRRNLSTTSIDYKKALIVCFTPGSSRASNSKDLPHYHPIHAGKHEVEKDSVTL